MILVSRQWYCEVDADGHERDVRWLRVGLGRWYVEAGRWGLAGRLGPFWFVANLDPSREEE